MEQITDNLHEVMAVDHKRSELQAGNKPNMSHELVNDNQSMLEWYAERVARCRVLAMAVGASSVGCP